MIRCRLAPKRVGQCVCPSPTVPCNRASHYTLQTNDQSVASECVCVCAFVRMGNMRHSSWAPRTVTPHDLRESGDPACNWTQDSKYI